jgi:hypothetical protein
MASQQSGLKRFSAQISFTAHSGYGSTASHRGSAKDLNAKDAFLSAIGELAWVAARAKWGADAKAEFESCLARAEGSFAEAAKAEA